MRYRAVATAIGTACVLGAAALAQGPGGGQGVGGNTTGKAAASPALQATVETASVALVYPDRYALSVVLEPNRKVFMMAPADGMLTDMTATVGTTVRATQVVAQLDRAEAAAKVKVAEANVKEAQAELARAKPGDTAVAQARLDAAKAKAELAQLELTRCTLSAPFGGKVLNAPVSPGQYVSKGQTLAELADYAILKVLVPVDRTIVKAGSDLELFIEGKPITGKVMALVPLPESYAALRELATPWAAAWVNINNSSASLEPGQRVRGPFAPTQPITAVPSRAVHGASEGSGVVQVARFGNVLDIPVKIIGDVGFDRTQVAGPFLPTDAAIVESSFPMTAGTVIRFVGEPPVSGAAGANPGALVDLTPPVGGPARPGAGRVAPIGSPDGNTTGKTGTRPATGAVKAAPKTTKPAPAAGGTPF
ncbi:MAG: hypothetical protein JWN86_3466 [Planctomycetota bacterium]|nr:hypothetical protein [Planctomycetota bacterium]